MFFGFFRSMRKNLWICILLVITALLFKKAYPDLGAQIGAWISGLGDTRVVRAFSALLTDLKEGEGLSSAVEVFCEGIR